MPSVASHRTSFASDPGRVRLSLSRLAFVMGQSGRAEEDEDTALLEEHLRHGDSRAAVVVSTQPLLVAAYTDELDCVVMLEFDDRVGEKHDLSVGSRLLTVNTYGGTCLPVEPDLDPGPDAGSTYHMVYPVIADFLSRDSRRIEARKAKISSKEWRRAQELGMAYLKDHPGVFRAGHPDGSCVPASLPLSHSSFVVGPPLALFLAGWLYAQPMPGEWSAVIGAFLGLAAGLAFVRLFVADDLRFFVRSLRFQRGLNSLTPAGAPGNVKKVTPLGVLKAVLLFFLGVVTA